MLLLSVPELPKHHKLAKEFVFQRYYGTFVRKVLLPVLFVISTWIFVLLCIANFSSPFTTVAYAEQQARFHRLQLARANTFEYSPPSLPSSLEALKHTRTKSIFITAVIHNNADFLRTTLKLLDKVGQMFHTYHIGFYENDSNDGTLKILADWTKYHSNKSRIHIISEKLNAKKAIEYGGAAKQRFDLMASYRNKYLEMVEKHAPNVDYVFVIDMDLFDTTLDAILSSFTPNALAMQWSAAGANGIYDGKRYYDTLAFRNSLFPDTRIRQQRYAAHVVYEPDAPWVPADSMFGGMVVYKRECLRGCRHELDGDCEHVSLYKCMAKKNGCDRFFINPAFVVDYQNFQLFLE